MCSIYFRSTLITLCVVFVGLARTVYIHRIWPYIWWNPCQKYRIHTVYIWFWPTLSIWSTLTTCLWSTCLPQEVLPQSNYPHNYPHYPHYPHNYPHYPQLSTWLPQEVLPQSNYPHAIIHIIIHIIHIIHIIIHMIHNYPHASLRKCYPRASCSHKRPRPSCPGGWNRRCGKWVEGDRQRGRRCMSKCKATKSRAQTSGVRMKQRWQQQLRKLSTRPSSHTCGSGATASRWVLLACCVC
jgi:hypothetical protein